MCVLGRVTDGDARLSDAGEIVLASWYEIPDRFPGVTVDQFGVIPNHIHGTIMLSGEPVGARLIAPSVTDTGDGSIRAAGSGAMNRAPTGGGNAPTIGEVVRACKAVSTRRIRMAGVRDFGWQRNYYEHVIRSDAALDRVRDYIIANPDHWPDDDENPNNPRARRIH